MRFIAGVLLLAACATASTPREPLPPIIDAPAPVMSAETRAQREKDLATARAAYEKNPNDADAIIWLGRRTAYLGDYKGAIEIF
ncbi:MAG TPA: hypothetical protein VF608_02410, partial [Thermoanaerobaculia bacterium]